MQRVNCALTETVQRLAECLVQSPHAGCAGLLQANEAGRFAPFAEDSHAFSPAYTCRMMPKACRCLRCSGLVAFAPCSSAHKAPWGPAALQPIPT